MAHPLALLAVLVLTGVIDVYADELETVPAAATPSDALREIGGDDEYEDESGGPDLSLSFLRGLYLLLSDTGAVDPGEERDVVPYESEDEEFSVEELADARAGSAVDSVSNVIAYDVTVNGVDYVLYISPDYVDSLYIDSQDRLWNVSTANISGRLFTGQFDVTATTGYLVTLGPCLGNNFSNNRNYGSPNYMRRYYWSGNTLTYDTTYITIRVNQSRYPFRVSDTLPYIMIILLGGGLICLWKRSVR